MKSTKSQTTQERNLLNKRTEIIAQCRQRRKHHLLVHNGRQHLKFVTSLYYNLNLRFKFWHFLIAELTISYTPLGQPDSEI